MFTSVALNKLNKLALALGLGKKKKLHRVYKKGTFDDSLKCVICKAKFDYETCVEIGKLEHCGKTMKHIKGYHLL